MGLISQARVVLEDWSKHKEIIEQWVCSLHFKCKQKSCLLYEVQQDFNSLQQAGLAVICGCACDLCLLLKAPFSRREECKQCISPWLMLLRAWRMWRQLSGWALKVELEKWMMLGQLCAVIKLESCWTQIDKEIFNKIPNGRVSKAGRHLLCEIFFDLLLANLSQLCKNLCWRWWGNGLSGVALLHLSERRL